MIKRVLSLALCLLLAVCQWPAHAYADTIISTVQVYISMPYANDTPSSQVHCWDSSAYKATSVDWHDDTAGAYIDSSTKFLKGHRYTAQIYLETKDGYKFNYDGTLHVTGRVNYQTAQVSKGFELDNEHELVLSYQFAPCVNSITYITMDIPTPMAGEAFYDRTKIVLDAENHFDTDDKPYLVDANMSDDGFVYGMRWKDETTGTYMGLSDTYIRGHQYSVDVALRARLSDDTGFYTVTDGQYGGTIQVNGKAGTAKPRTPYDYKMLIVSYTIPGACCEEIKNVSVTGIITPVGGMHPSFEATVSGTGYHLYAYESQEGDPVGLQGYTNGVRWRDHSGAVMYADSVYRAGNRYHVRVMLEADDNYEFPAEGEEYFMESALINGQKAMPQFGWNNVPGQQYRKYLVLDYLFSEADTQDVESFDVLAVTVPKPGNTPAYTGLSAPIGAPYEIYTKHTKEEQYTISGVHWQRVEGDKLYAMKPTDEFAARKQYMVTVWVRMKDANYRFVPIPAATVNGEAGSNVQVSENFSSWARVSYTFYCDPQIVETAGVQIAEPEGSKAPSFEATPWDSPNVQVKDFNEGDYIHGVAWWDATDSAYLTEESVFTEGHDYTAYVMVEPAKGWEFAVDDTDQSAVLGFVNGVPAAVSGLSPQQELVLSYDYPDCGGIVIHEADLTVDEPKADALPGYALILPEDAPYEPATFMGFTGGIRWWDDTEGRVVASDEPFIDGHDYRVDVLLSSKEGYDFCTDASSDPAVTAYINGTQALVSSHSAPAKDQVLVQYYFFNVGHSIITSVNVDVVIPVNGEQASFEAVTGSAEYFAWNSPDDEDFYAGVNWVDYETMETLQPGDAFVGGHTYLVSILVKPAAGWAFDEGIAYMTTLNSAIATVTTADNGCLLVGTDYECPLQIVSSAAVVSVETPIAGKKAEPSGYVVSGDPYYVDSMEWVDKEEGRTLSANETFVLGRTYTAVLKLKPAEGCAFDFTVDVKVNGEAAYVWGSEAEQQEVHVDFVCRAIISEIEVTGIAEPTPGAKPSYAYAIPDGVPYEVAKVTWYTGQEIELGPSAGFATEESYFVQIDLAAKENAAFEAFYDDYLERYLASDDIAATVNGQTVQASNYDYLEDARYNVSLRLYFAPCGMSLIGSVDITGVPIPEIGDRAGDFMTGQAADAAPYVVSSVDWYDITEDRFLEADDCFEAFHDYLVDVIVQAKDGYAFPAYYNGFDYEFVPGNTAASINGEECTIVSADGFDGRFYVDVYQSVFIKQPAVATGVLEDKASHKIHWAVMKEGLDMGTVMLNGKMIVAEPVLVAYYDEDGRFLGLRVATADNQTIEPEIGALGVQLFWIDDKWAPVCESANVPLN